MQEFCMNKTPMGVFYFTGLPKTVFIRLNTLRFGVLDIVWTQMKFSSHLSAQISHTQFSQYYHPVLELN
jgi:hypothetical protein